jgi:hypothetical protein
MNKNQVAKRTKRKQVSKQKKKQRNIERVEKQKAGAVRKQKLMEFFVNLSKNQQRKVLKDMDKGDEE